jgi:hypothetical protein
LNFLHSFGDTRSASNTASLQNKSWKIRLCLLKVFFYSSPYLPSLQPLIFISISEIIIATLKKL